MKFNFSGVDINLEILNELRDPCSAIHCLNTTEKEIVQELEHYFQLMWNTSSIKPRFVKLMRAGIVYKEKSEVAPDKYNFKINLSHPDMQPVIEDFNRRFSKSGLYYSPELKPTPEPEPEPEPEPIKYCPCCGQELKTS